MTTNSIIYCKTAELLIGDLLHTADGDYLVLTMPRPGGLHGRLIFEARPIESLGVIEEHHAQPDFEWEVIN